MFDAEIENTCAQLDKNALKSVGALPGKIAKPPVRSKSSTSSYAVSPAPVSGYALRSQTNKHSDQKLDNSTPAPSRPLATAHLPVPQEPIAGRELPPSPADVSSSMATRRPRDVWQPFVDDDFQPQLHMDDRSVCGRRSSLCLTSSRNTALGIHLTS